MANEPVPATAPVTSRTSSESVAASFKALTVKDQKKAKKAIQKESPGLFDLDGSTRKMIWIMVFVLLGLVAVIALLAIWHSWSVDITTTTGTGANRTRTITHPDVSAAWAVVSAVVAGVVGLLVPSPTSAPSSSAAPK